MKNRLKGFTLLESILYIGLFSIILLIVVSFMLTTQESNVRTKNKESLHKSSQFLTQHINYTFENAQSIDEVNSTFESESGKLTVVINGESKVYELQTSKLYYNGILISPSDILVERFYLKPIYQDTDIVAVRVEITLRNKENTTLVEDISLLATFR